MSHRAVFLDRDGTVIRDVGYPSDPERVQLLPGAGEALAAECGPVVVWPASGADPVVCTGEQRHAEPAATSDRGDHS